MKQEGIVKANERIVNSEIKWTKSGAAIYLIQDGQFIIVYPQQLPELITQLQNLLNNE